MGKLRKFFRLYFIVDRKNRAETAATSSRHTTLILPAHSQTSVPTPGIDAVDSYCNKTT
jgi:hypothetical protein